ncbi:hypothetical protein IJ531_03150 [bacterium]|nr:hypothetical protein [bacterium]
MGKLLGFTFLSVCFCYFYNKIQAFVKMKKRKKLLEQMQMKKQQEYLKSLKEYSAINNFAICLSLDYKSKRQITPETKSVINKVIFAKMQETLLKTIKKIDIKNLQDVLIVMSGDFNMYDFIYDNILKILSKIKMQVDERYGVYMVPSITTDAYTIRPELDVIKKNHMNIKHCDFRGKACSTKTFSKKYKHMNKNKYMGTPLGEYSILDEEKTNTYELNMVYKNLSSQLESMGQ